MTSTAYSRQPKLPGGGGERRLPPRLMRGLASKIEPKKLGVGLVAGCCLALLTHVSLASSSKSGLCLDVKRFGF